MKSKCKLSSINLWRGKFTLVTLFSIFTCATAVANACTRDYWDMTNLYVSRYCKGWSGKELRMFDSTSKVRALLGASLTAPNRKATFTWNSGGSSRRNAPGRYSINDTRQATWRLSDLDSNAGKGTITEQHSWPNVTYRITCGSGNINLQFIGDIYKYHTNRKWGNFEVNNNGNARKYGNQNNSERVSQGSWVHLNDRYVQPQNHNGPSNCYQ